MYSANSCTSESYSLNKPYQLLFQIGPSLQLRYLRKIKGSNIVNNSVPFHCGCRHGAQMGCRSCTGCFEYLCVVGGVPAIICLSCTAGISWIFLIWACTDLIGCAARGACSAARALAVIGVLVVIGRLLVADRTPTLHTMAIRTTDLFHILIVYYWTLTANNSGPSANTELKGCSANLSM